MRIGVDIDGVCYDMRPVLEHFIEKYFNKRPTATTPNDWNIAEGAGLSRSEVARLFAIPDLYTYGQPIIGASESLNRLYNDGHALVYVTARPQNVIKITKYWLGFHNFPVATFVISGRGRDKVSIAEYLKLNLFIEDKAETILSFEEAGIPVIAFAQPWNNGVGKNRIVSWARIVDYISGNKE